VSDEFTAVGELNLTGAHLGADFFCRNGKFAEALLNLTDASATTLVDSGLNDGAAGSPENSPPTVWPEPGRLILDGFAHGRISSRGQINVSRRLDWLALQPRTPFRPYLQLATIVRESGDSKGALRLLERMEDVRRIEEGHGPVART